MKSYVVLNSISVWGVHLQKGDILVCDPSNGDSVVAYRGGSFLKSVKHTKMSVTAMVKSRQIEFIPQERADGLIKWEAAPEIPVVTVPQGSSLSEVVPILNLTESLKIKELPEATPPAAKESEGPTEATETAKETLEPVADLDQDDSLKIADMLKVEPTKEVGLTPETGVTVSLPVEKVPAKRGRRPKMDKLDEDVPTEAPIATE